MHIEGTEDLGDALAVDEDVACEAKGLDVVAEGVAAGDGESLDVREALVEEQRLECLGPRVLVECLFGGGAEDLGLLRQVHERALEMVRHALKVVGAELELERSANMPAQHRAEVHAAALEVGHDFLVRRVAVHGRHGIARWETENTGAEILKDLSFFFCYF